MSTPLSTNLSQTFPEGDRSGGRSGYASLRATSRRGSDWGLDISYAVQPDSGGLVQAFLIAAEKLTALAAPPAKSDYGQYLQEILREEAGQAK